LVPAEDNHPVLLNDHELGGRPGRRNFRSIFQHTRDMHFEMRNNGGSYTIDLIDSGGTTVYTYSGTTSSGDNEQIEHIWFDFEGPITFQKEVLSMGSHDDYGTWNEFIYYTPEPATVAILGLGSLVLLRRRR
jgi:hypothetical protein